MIVYCPSSTFVSARILVATSEKIRVLLEIEECLLKDSGRISTDVRKCTCHVGFLSFLTECFYRSRLYFLSVDVVNAKDPPLARLLLLERTAQQIVV